MRQTQTLWISGLLAITVGGLAAQERVPKDRQKAGPAACVRVLKDRDGVPEALQTAVVRFVPASGDGDLVVDLVGAVHYGDRAYYQRLNGLFRQYDAVLYELVAPAGSRVPKGMETRVVESPIRLFQRMSQAALDLESQLERIDYTATNFVHADLSPREMLETIRKRGDDGLTLMLGVTADLMRQFNADQQKPAVQRARAAMTAVDPFDQLLKTGGATRLKRSFALELERQTAPGGGMGRTIERILIDDRNAAAMRVFQKQLAKGHKRIAIFYGAAHMPDFEKRLRLDFDLRRQKVEWYTAWDLQRESGSALGGILKVLGDELTRELGPRPQREEPRRPAPTKKPKKSRIF